MPRLASGLCWALCCVLLCGPALAENPTPSLQRPSPIAPTPPPGGSAVIVRPGEQPTTVQRSGERYLGTRPGQLPRPCTPVGGRLVCP